MPGWLIIHELVHLLIGLVIGGLLWRGLGDRRVFIAAILTSMFIDIDHLYDYSLALWPHLNPSAIMNGTYFANTHIYIFLHSWELTALLIALGILFKRKSWGIISLGIGVAMFGHILMDKIWYGTPWELYSLGLRIYHHFSVPADW